MSHSKGHGSKRQRPAHEDNGQAGKPGHQSGHNHNYYHGSLSGQEDDYIPLPIQTFLWRQTSAFVRPLMGKSRDLSQIEQRDACKLFERIIITNNVWGQSPSLTDAIASIDRWRLIKVSFPFVMQCTASLLNNKLTRDGNLNRLGGNEAKMMYTLQWILMNASEECADSEQEAKVATLAVASAAHQLLLKPSQTGSGGGGGPNPSALMSMGSSNTSSSQEVAAGSQTAGAGAGSGGLVGQSIMIPAVSAFVAVPSVQTTKTSSPAIGTTTTIISKSVTTATTSTSQQQPQQSQQHSQQSRPHQQQQQSSSSVSPIGSTTPTKQQVTPTGSPMQSANRSPTNMSQLNAASATSNFLLPVSSIQMFVYHFGPLIDSLKHSDFLTSNQRLEIGSTLWAPLFNHQLPNVQCLAAPIRGAAITSTSISSPVQVVGPTHSQSATKFVYAPELDRKRSSTVVGPPGVDRRPSHLQQQQQHQPQSQPHQHQQLPVSTLDDSRRRSSSILHQIEQMPSHYGDVFIGGPTNPSAAKRPSAETIKLGAQFDPVGASGAETLVEPALGTPTLRSETATYLDVAVLRCLFMPEWQEAGVFWASSYLSNRLDEMLYPTDFAYSLGSFGAGKRSASLLAKRRANSLPSLFGATSMPGRGSDTFTRTIKKCSKAQKQKQAEVSSSPRKSSKEASKPCKKATNSGYLKVDDGDSSDADGSKSNGGRRLSFSTGMQTLANQIRRTSKRVKKGDQEQMAPRSPTLRLRRSSSADDLNNSQLSSLAGAHKESLMQQQQLDYPSSRLHLAESNPIITVVANDASGKVIEPDGSSPGLTGSDEDESELRSAKLQTGACVASSGSHKDKIAQQEQQQQQHYNLVHKLYLRSLRRLERLTRSQSLPKNIHFAPFETLRTSSDQLESLGASHYIDQNNCVSPLVVLKVLHSIIQRESACSQRVCDKLLTTIGRLIDIGILRSEYHSANNGKQSKQHHRELIKLLPTRTHQYNDVMGPSQRPPSFGHNTAAQVARGCAKTNRKQANQEPDDDEDEDGDYEDIDERDAMRGSRDRRGGCEEQAKSRIALIHKILLDIVFRLYNHLGCPNNCGFESTVEQHKRNKQLGASAKSGATPSLSLGANSEANADRRLRSRLQSTLDMLYRFNQANFIDYVNGIVAGRSIQQVVDVLHCVLGFCCSDYINGLVNQQQQAKSRNESLSSSLSEPSGDHQAPISQQQPQQQAPGAKSARFQTQTSVSSGASIAHGRPKPQTSGPQEAPTATGSASVATVASANIAESAIIRSSCKFLITKMASVNRELKLQENTALYCDIRRLISFVRENYSNTFRTIVLSALIDSTQVLKQQQKLDQHQQNYATTNQQQQHQNYPNLNHKGGVQLGSDGAQLDRGPPSDDDSQASRRLVGRFAQPTDSEAIGADSTTFGMGQSAPIPYIDQSVGDGYRGAASNIASATSLRQTPTSPQSSGLQHQQQQQQQQGLLSLSKAKKKLEQVFGGGKPSGRYGASKCGDSGTSAGEQQAVGGDPQCVMAGSSSGPTGDDPQTSRRTSVIGNQSLGSVCQDSGAPTASGGACRPAPGATSGASSGLGLLLSSLAQSSASRGRLVDQGERMYSAVRVGMSNFSFLMESCAPGELLEPALLAALLDLQSPIAIRAAIFLECAQLVNRCNKGLWPSWMKMHITSQWQGRNSVCTGASGLGRNRKSSSIQRTARNNTMMYRVAGKAFYLWAEAVGSRLEELIQAERCASNITGGQHQDDATSQKKQDPQPLASGSANFQEPNNSSSLLIDMATSELAALISPEVDLFQPTLNGSTTPFVLKMAACQLLFEVTTFLRETYRYLPPSMMHHHQLLAGGKLGDNKLSSIYDVSRAVTANRRWSMALSSLGFGQLPAALTAAGTTAAVAPQTTTSTTSSSLGIARNSTLAGVPIAEHPSERKISFVLHETAGESDQEAVPAGSSSSIGVNASVCGDLGASDAGSLDGGAAGSGPKQVAAPTPGRHLSQSSASSAVVVAAATLLRSSGMIESQSHRRKSIKLRKPSQSSQQQKDQQQQQQQLEKDKKAKFTNLELDEEPIDGSIDMLRRTDSLKSKGRRVSGISERSDNSNDPGTLPANSGEDSASGGGGATGATSAPGPAEDSMGQPISGAAQQQPQVQAQSTIEQLERTEADDSKLMSNMPWFRAIALVNASIDCTCSHLPKCASNCYKLHQNMCKRLVSCVTSIYQTRRTLADDADDHEHAHLAQLLERRLAALLADQTNSIARTGSDCSQSASEILRDSSQSANSAATGTTDHLQRLSKASRDSRSELVSTPSGTRGARDGSKGAKSEGDGSQQTPSKRRGANDSGRSSSRLAMHRASIENHQGALQGAQQLNLILSDAIRSFAAARARKLAAYEAGGAQHASAWLSDESAGEPTIVRYLRFGVRSLLQCPMSAFLKGAVILSRESFLDMIEFSWRLLLEDDQQLARTAAVCFIISSIRCPAEASTLLLEELASQDAARKVAAMLKFQVIWDARYQCWPRLEDGAFVHFKMAPPSVEFTLPSPKIAQECKPVVDPPWMPRKSSNVEEVTIGQDQSVQKSFVTATKTRRKQQIELVTRALREKHDKLRQGREDYHISSVPVSLYAAYEPAGGVAGVSVSGAPGDDSGEAAAPQDDDQQAGGVQDSGRMALIQMKTAQALFPTCLCQAAIVLINLLDDSRVTYEGCAVYEVANKVIWSCLVEDPSLFLRYFFERLTRQSQNAIFRVLRRLIRFMPRLPAQAAHTLYNYLVGFVVYYIRSPVGSSQKLIADTLSVLCLVVPSVYGLFLKDLKQIFRKEQCDHNLLITANVPSAKKIIVHGSDSSGIPSQFPIDESTQFYHILMDSLEFFGVEKSKHNEYFLIDVRTNHMHSLQSYVRDHYSFKRSQHPQLQLVNMDPDKAFYILQRQELINQFMDFGKVLMTHTIVKSSHMAVQRALFLHEELMKLPSFPRRALETNFGLFRGPLGHQVFSMDRVHKVQWVRLIARMFELTSGFFLQLGELHLFLNTVSGVLVLHCEDASVLRLCLATYINAAYQFKNIFAVDGFTPIMATLIQVYSNHQNNQLLCRSIEFVCKQFYIMHRKPFLLQLFGSVASKLNTAEIQNQSQSTSLPMSQLVGASGNSGGASRTSSPLAWADPNLISPGALFRLLQSLDRAFKDPLDIFELVEIEKPLRAVDFCYQQDKEVIEMLDIISLCVTVTAYASDSPRSTQMLIILEAVVPLYMRHLQTCTSKKAGQSMGKQAHKDELQKIQNISICIRTLIINCEGLTRNFSGSVSYIDFRSSSIRRRNVPTGSASGNNKQSSMANSPGALRGDDEHSHSDNAGRSRLISQPGLGASGIGLGLGKASAGSGSGLGDMRGGAAGSALGASSTRANAARNAEETEMSRAEFIVPRDTLLNLVAEFLSLSTVRLVESAKKYVDLHQKHSSYELLDVKSHLRLAEVANSLLKFASTDPSVMNCRGLVRYMTEIVPNTEWRQEAIRPALIMILKRLDKTFNRIAKKNSVRRSTDWEGAKQLLKGAYLTFIKHPYIVHLPHLKSLISCCQNIVLSDTLAFAGAPLGHHAMQSSPSTGFFHHHHHHGHHGHFHSQHSSQQQQPNTSTNNYQQPQASQVSMSQSASMIVGTQGASSWTSAGFGGVSSGATNLLQVSGNMCGSGSSLAPSASGVNIPAGSRATGFVERLAPSTGALACTLTTPSAAASSQAFNSVTIRLIAMQLLQAGDNQSLESLVGSNVMSSPERLESVTLNLMYPMCIRVCSGSREAPKLRSCDISYMLTLILGLLAPSSPSARSRATAGLGTQKPDASQLILSKITTTLAGAQSGAVGHVASMVGVATQAASHHQATVAAAAAAAAATASGSNGHHCQAASGVSSGATPAHSLHCATGGGPHQAGGAHHGHGAQPSPNQQQSSQDALKIGFLGLKILCVCFESQLAGEWVRIARVIRDLAMQPGQPTGPLWDFLDFVTTYRYPMFVLLLPVIRCQLARKVKLENPNQQSYHYNIQCHKLIDAKLQGIAHTVCRSKSFLFVSLTAELRMLKEQLAAKRRMQLEGERMGGPTQAAGSNASCHHQAGQQHGHSSTSGGQQQAFGANNPNQSHLSTGGCQQDAASGASGSQCTEHSTAYHRLSAAIAMFANPGGSSPSSGLAKQVSMTTALKASAGFAAQIGTSAPIGPQQQAAGAPGIPMGLNQGQHQPNPQSSVRLSTAKTREEARMVMNTILRRTSYPHHEEQQQQHQASSAQPGTSGDRPNPVDKQSQQHQQQPIIMSPANLMMSAFNMPRKSTSESSSGLLKSLIKTIDRQNNQKQQQQQQQQQQQPQQLLPQSQSQPQQQQRQQPPYQTTSLGQATSTGSAEHQQLQHQAQQSASGHHIVQMPSSHRHQ